MTEQVRQANYVGVQTRQNEDGTHEITIAANNIARDNLDVDLDSLRLDNYLRNPVVLWAHNMTIPPIGRAVAVTKADGKITARFEFAKGNRFAEDIENLWNQGILRAASIRWDGGDVSFPDTGPLMRFTGSELIEWSIVPVGSDPDALRQAARSLSIPMRRLMVPHIEEARMTKRQMTLEEIEAQLAELQAQVGDLTERVDALEDDEPEEQPEEASEGSEAESGDDTEERQALAKLRRELRLMKGKA